MFWPLSSHGIFKVLHDSPGHAVEVINIEWGKICWVWFSEGMEHVENCGNRIGRFW